jgi:hypothetical protein
MPIDTISLLSLWKLDEIPACDEGMELARSFLEACGDAVDRVGGADTAGLRTEFTTRYNTFLTHYAKCPKC